MTRLVNKSTLYIAIILSLVPFFGFAQTPNQLDLILSPTNQSSILQQQAVEKLKDKYRDQLQVKTYYLIEKQGDHFQSPYGPMDYQEARRQKIIQQHFPKQYQAYLDARYSELYSPVWEHAATWAKLDTQKIETLVETSDEPILWQGDLAVIAEHTIQKSPAILINKKILSIGQIGLVPLDSEIKKHLGLAKSLSNISIIIDPQTPQPVKDLYQQHLNKYVINSRINWIGINEELEQELINQQLFSLPAVFVSDEFLKSYYKNHLPIGESRKIKDIGTNLPLLDLKDTVLSESKNNKIDVYIQAQCPYATQLVLQLLETNKSGLNLPSFIFEYQKENNRYSCYHGEEELNETKRQLVIQKYYPDRYFDYFKTLYTDPDQDWGKSLKKAGINKQQVEQLVKKEADELLANHFKKIENLPLIQSPTVIANGCYIISDINQYFKQEKIQLTGSCGNCDR